MSVARVTEITASSDEELRGRPAAGRRPRGQDAEERRGRLGAGADGRGAATAGSPRTGSTSRSPSCSRTEARRLPGRVFLAAIADELAGHFGAAPTALAEPGTQREGAGRARCVAVVAGRRLVAMRWGLIPMGRTKPAAARCSRRWSTPAPRRCSPSRPSPGSAAPAAGRRLVRVDRPAAPPPALDDPRARPSRSSPSPRSGTSGARPGGAEVASLATVTCAPNPEVAAVHDRMPAILDRDAWPVWLGEADGDPAALLRPWPEGRLVTEEEDR